MASPTYSYLQQFVNLVLGEGENAAKRVDATYVNDLATDICRSIAERMACGDHAVDTGGSGAAQTVVWIYSDSDRLGLIKAGDWFKVTELATGSIWTGTISVDDICSFSTLGAGVDGLLVEGIAPPNYAAPAFINDLRFEFRHALHSKTQMQQLNLDAAAVGGLDTAVIERPGGAFLEVDLAALEVAFAVEHNLATGFHDDGIIDEANFTPECFNNMNFGNNLLANGGAELSPGAAGESGGFGVAVVETAPFYWAGVAGRMPGGGIFSTSTQAYRGQRSCRCDFTANLQAVDIELLPDLDITQYRGMDVALSVRVMVGVADSMTVGFNGAIGGEDLTADLVGTVGAWVVSIHNITIDAAETGLTARVVNNFAGVNTVYIDAAIVVRGTKAPEYSLSTWERDALNARDGSIIDLACNGNFEYWTNGVAVDPDCWETFGLATVAQDTVVFAKDLYSADVTLPDNAAGFRHTVGYVGTSNVGVYMRERYVTAKFKVQWVAGTRFLHATLRTNIGGNTVTEVIDLPAAVGTFIPCAVIRLEVDPAATDIFLEFENLDIGVPTPIQFNLDDVQITPTPWPCAPIIPSYWTLEIMAWSFYGVCDPALAAVDLAKGDVYLFTTNLGVQAGFYGTLLRMYAEAEVGPAAAAIDFDITANGAAAFGTVTITNPATEGQSHINAPPPGGWTLVNPADNLQVTARIGGTACEDVVVRAVFLRKNSEE